MGDRQRGPHNARNERRASVSSLGGASHGRERASSSGLGTQTGRLIGYARNVVMLRNFAVDEADPTLFARPER